MTVIELAAHTAYLDPQTGTGYLVLPHPDSDVEPLMDPLVGAAWSERLSDSSDPGPLSLHAADWLRTIDRLADMGWTLLRDEDGNIEIAGTDGRQAVCLYGPPTIEQPTLEALDRAIIALDIAAGLDLRSGHSGDAATNP
ncbi:hypothetical protein AB0E63_43420 [Kribbella sp. NPDC026596]|uniref:hypothetical protein n=1 Tax=Kribbella sp. NPDC026596 TaxID=3155122 RepID=UPI0033C8E086